MRGGAVAASEGGPVAASNGDTVAASGDGPPPVPRYGERSLAEVVPSVLAALGLEGFGNSFGIAPLGRACVLVIDALGWEMIRDHAADAPFLASAQHLSEPVTAGFPATTATSLASLACGLPPGEHGLVGYSFAVPGHERPMNALLWQLYGIGPHVDLTEDLPPETMQPYPTLMERSEASGLAITVAGPSAHQSSSLTRAILRGGPYRAADTLEALVEAATAGLHGARRAAAYAYYPWLDTAGHVYGVGADQWLMQLRLVDGLAESIAEHLPPGAALFVTADHGTVNLSPEQRLDVADHPALMDGVRFLGGEARARHVYTQPGADRACLQVWREALGDRMWVASRDQAIEEGWFGPRLAAHVRPRIGDVVAAARGQIGIVQRDVDPLQATFMGHHGSMTPAEQLVPLLEFRA